MSRYDIRIRITTTEPYKHMASNIKTRLNKSDLEVEINIVKECVDYKVMVSKDAPFLQSNVDYICNSLSPISFEQVEIVKKKKNNADVEIFLGSRFGIEDTGIQIIAHHQDLIRGYQEHLKKAGLGICASGIRDNLEPKIVYGDGIDLFWISYLAWLTKMPSDTVFIHDPKITTPMIEIYPISEARLQLKCRKILSITIRTNDRKAGETFSRSLKVLGFRLNPVMLYPEKYQFYNHFLMSMVSPTGIIPQPHLYKIFENDLQKTTEYFLQHQLKIPLSEYPFYVEEPFSRDCSTYMLINLPFATFKRGKLPAYALLGRYECLIITDNPKAVKPLRKRLLQAGLGDVSIRLEETPILREVVFSKESILQDSPAQQKILQVVSSAIDAEEIPEPKFRYAFAAAADIVIRMPISETQTIPDENG